MSRKKGCRCTGVDEVVGVVVVADGTGLCLVELRVFDFFELDHGRGSLMGCEVECAIVSVEVGIRVVFGGSCLRSVTGVGLFFGVLKRHGIS